MNKIDESNDRSTIPPFRGDARRAGGYQNIFLKQPRRGKTREALITPHKRSAVWGETDKAEPQCGGRAPRNRTLTVTAGEIPALEPLVSAVGDLRAGFRDDMLVNGDLLECLDLIPDGLFDLILLDPPYNLDKDFHGRKFSSMQSDDYEEFLRSWFGKVCDKLKPTGSLYMCGDWKCSSSMQRVIEERLTILNRITWHGLSKSDLPSSTASPGNARRAAEQNPTGRTAWRTSGSP